MGYINCQLGIKERDCFSEQGSVVHHTLGFIEAKGKFNCINSVLGLRSNIFAHFY